MKNKKAKNNKIAAKKQRYLKIGAGIMLCAVLYFGVRFSYRHYLESLPGSPVGATAQPQPVNQRPVPSALLEKDANSTSKTVQGKENEESVLTGVVADVSTEKVYVKDEASGEILSFARGTAEVTGRLVVDVKIEVHYTGTIVGNDASNAYVTKLFVFPS